MKHILNVKHVLNVSHNRCQNLRIFEEYLGIIGECEACSEEQQPRREFSLVMIESMQ